MKIRHIRALLLLMMAACALPIQAQIRGSEIQVNVVPDHQDWTYEVGQTATFQISVTRSATLVDGVTIDYEAGPEMYQDVKKKGVVLKDGTLTLKGKMTKPGFYRVDVKAYVDGKEYKGACGAAFLEPHSRQRSCNPPPLCLRTLSHSGRMPLPRLVRLT